MALPSTVEYIGQKVIQLQELQQQIPGHDKDHDWALDGRIKRLEAARTAIRNTIGMEPAAYLLVGVTGGISSLIRRCVEDDMSELELLTRDNHPLRRMWDDMTAVGLKALEEIDPNGDSLKKLRVRYGKVQSQTPEVTPRQIQGIQEPAVR